jgi:hypothetical protein
MYLPCAWAGHRTLVQLTSSLLVCLAPQPAPPDSKRALLRLTDANDSSPFCIP